MSKTIPSKDELIYWKNQETPKTDEIFTDPLFPPTLNSLLGLDSSGKPIDIDIYNKKKDQIETDKIGFFRVKEILKENYCLFADKIEVDDVIQGTLGDCYFLTAISNLCKYPDKIRKMFKQSSKNEKGFYEIEFFIDGEKQIVIVDDFFPADKTTKELVYARANKNQIWVILLEKAWAKINGGYINIISGRVYEALEFLIGRGSILYNFEDKEGDDLINLKRKIIKNIQLADKKDCVISCSTKDDPNLDKVGLVPTHAYSILDFLKIKTSQDNDVFLFKIRNPWAKVEWKGDWSDTSSLWDSKTKSQVQYEDKDDGIFYINESDFFKFFNSVEICYLFLDSEEVIYEIEGKENLKNGAVFNIEVEKEGYLNVSIQKENWRIHRDLKDILLPSHLSIVKYDPLPKNRLKTFIKYYGNFEALDNCTLNMRIKKGNYLIYFYRDFDHAKYNAKRKIKLKILCSSKYKHAQMSYDERAKGFPLLQNIILQTVIKECKYNPDSGKSLFQHDNQLKDNGLGYLVQYIPTPGYFYNFTGALKKNKNMNFLTPFLDSKTTEFNNKIPSGKYHVVLGLRSGDNPFNFNCYTEDITTAKNLTADFLDNDIDLALYTDFNNNIKSEKYEENKLKILKKEKKEFYSDNVDGKIEYKSLEELQKEYGEYMKLLDDIEITLEDYDKYRKEWGIIKTKYYIFIGELSGDVKFGKGLYINQNNIFAGQFYSYQTGKGYTYDSNFRKLYYCVYKDGHPEGEPVTYEKELEEIEQKNKLKEEELKKEQERLQKIKEEKEALLKKKEKDLALYLINAAQEKKKKEEKALALKKAEEEALAEKKRIEEERQKEMEKQKAELERIEKEKQQKIEEAKKKAEEYKKEQEALAKAILQKAMEIKIKDKKTELEEKEKQEQKEKSQINLKDIEQKSKEKEEKLIGDIISKAEEETKKLEEEKILHEKKMKEMKEQAEKKLKEIKEETESKEKEEEKLKEQKREEAKKQIEELKIQLKKTKEEEQKVHNAVSKNSEEMKKASEEIEKIKQKKEQEEKERLEQERKEEDFGVEILYPEYLKDEPKKKEINRNLNYDENDNNECVLCSCNII